ncbi:hypothetical protein KY290_017416 [Solanum tuberosum]|uniref:Non-LTR retroelement reverse transcriptase n=1 Tax=Solanum tuberosum TaxID=4113 RepID=A0ABQ7VB74_SOLTU|nr:hypothetical protein KY290_017416 [Solanum tuberosum]
MEPFQGPYELELYKIKLGTTKAYSNCSDKIWVFLEEDWDGEVIKDCTQQITMRLRRDKLQVLIIAVYGRCDAMEMMELWEEFEDIAETNQSLWMVGGDFNVITKEEEKQGGLVFTQAEAIHFNQCINNCALIEMKYMGSKFTWWNGSIEDDCIFKRLDRVMCNQELLDTFPSSEIHHLVRRGSDHAPLHVVCNSEEEINIKPFKFLNFWSKHPNFTKVVEDNWKIDFMGSPFVEFQVKMKKVKGALAKWSKETFGNIFQQIATLEDAIRVKEIQLELNPSAENRATLNKGEVELKKYLYLEGEFWKQKVGMRWFKDGDRKSKEEEGDYRLQKFKQIKGTGLPLQII